MCFCFLDRSKLLPKKNDNNYEDGNKNENLNEHADDDENEGFKMMQRDVHALKTMLMMRMMLTMVGC